MSSKSALTKRTRVPRIGPKVLFVTPEISYVSKKITKDAERLRAKAGGLADVSALLVDSLYRNHRDLHLAIPNYRHLFQTERSPDQGFARRRLKFGSRIHLAEDCRFYRRQGVYQVPQSELFTSSLAFQREVINHIIPQVQPDVIHCNDWMTGLIPAAAKKMGIPCLFTIHNVHSEIGTLADMENRGIPGSDFWQELFYTNYPGDFDDTFWNNGVDFLASGIMAADHVNVVSPTFLDELVEGRHPKIGGPLSELLYHKKEAGAATGITNAPDNSFNPRNDDHLPAPYSADNHREAKAANKRSLQEQLGLKVDGNAPVFFWPSRLDPIQKGCQLLSDILYQLTHDYREVGIQFIIVADGPYYDVFHNIVNQHGLHDRVAIRPFDEALSHRAYGSSDFVLMPSSFEPCGLPQMIGARYGTLPIAHQTGGLADTVFPLEVEKSIGNGFLFEVFDSGGLRWAIDQAVAFHTLPAEKRESETARIMTEALELYDTGQVVDQYVALYEELAKKGSGNF